MKTIVAFLLAAFVNASVSEQLEVPSIVTVEFQPARTNYIAVYGVTNNTLQSIRITGKATSCGCTSISVSKEQIGPAETATVTVSVNSIRPATNSVLLIDSRNNIFHTRVALTPK